MAQEAAMPCLEFLAEAEGRGLRADGGLRAEAEAEAALRVEAH